MKLTPWFCAVTQPPVRPGWYDVRYAGNRREHPARFWWTGQSWRDAPRGQWPFFGMEGDLWRGLLGDERGPFKEK